MPKRLEKGKILKIYCLKTSLMQLGFSSKLIQFKECLDIFYKKTWRKQQLMKWFFLQLLSHGCSDPFPLLFWCLLLLYAWVITDIDIQTLLTKLHQSDGRRADSFDPFMKKSMRKAFRLASMNIDLARTSQISWIYYKRYCICLISEEGR